MTEQFPARLSPIINSLRQSLLVPGLIKGEKRDAMRAKLARYEAEVARRIEAKR